MRQAAQGLGTMAVLVLFLVVVAPTAARADAGSTGEEGDSLPCGSTDFKGCCELDTAYYCDETGALQTIWCANNATHTTCGLEGPFVNCMADGASVAPRCSDVPQPTIGVYRVDEDPGDLAGTCPTLPTRLAMNPDAPSTCEGAPAALDLVQSGCTFVVTPMSDGAAGLALGQIDGRVVQLSYQRGDTAVTCLARVADDDSSLSGACDGPWGFDDTACTWSYTGTFTWPGPQPTPASTGGGDSDAPGGGNDTVRDPEGGGGSSCATGAGNGSTLAAIVVFALLAGMATRRSRRRDR